MIRVRSPYNALDLRAAKPIGKPYNGNNCSWEFANEKSSQQSKRNPNRLFGGGSKLNDGSSDPIAHETPDFGLILSTPWKAYDKVEPIPNNQGTDNSEAKCITPSTNRNSSSPWGWRLAGWLVMLMSARHWFSGGVSLLSTWWLNQTIWKILP